MKQSLEQDERDERSGVPQACCLELDHGLSLERGKRWFTDFFQVLAELQQDLVLDEVSHALLQHSFTQRLQAHHPWHTVDLMERVYPVPL